MDVLLLSISKKQPDRKIIGIMDPKDRFTKDVLSKRHGKDRMAGKSDNPD